MLSAVKWEKLPTKTGFVHTDKTRRELAFGEARTARQLLITTEMCAVYKETAFPCGRA